MKRVELSPYKRWLCVYDSKAEFEKRWGPVGDQTIGRTTFADYESHVWAKDRAALVHELAHVALHIFELIDADPRQANGEPFCYLMEHMFRRATKCV
jgi:hypothetical protein